MSSFSIVLLSNFAQNSQDLRRLLHYILVYFCVLLEAVSLYFVYEDSSSHTKKPTDHSNLSIEEENSPVVMSNFGKCSWTTRNLSSSKTIFEV